MGIISKYPLKVMQEVEPFPPIQNTASPYATEAAMYADQANQLEGYGYLVDGAGAFTYLGTVAGTAADYEPFSNKYSKDIILRSANTSSSIKFLDSLTNDTLGFFMRYNAANNFFEIGSNDGAGDVIVAKIDRGKTDWEFQDRIQILKKGRGISLIGNSGSETDGNQELFKYEVTVEDGGVLNLKDSVSGGLASGKILVSNGLSGTTANRPVNGTVYAMKIGFQYFDTSIGKPIWWNGTGWIDSSGVTI